MKTSYDPIDPIDVKLVHQKVGNLHLYVSVPAGIATGVGTTETQALNEFVKVYLRWCFGRDPNGRLINKPSEKPEKMEIPKNLPRIYPSKPK